MTSPLPLAPQESEKLRDRFRGTLAGLAVGDALGAPLEFQPARDPAHYHTEMTGGGWLKLKPGEYTDDTQMTLATVESLLERKVFDPDDIARRFAAWFESSPADVGNHTRQVLTDIRKGIGWEQASRSAQEADPDSASNGSLMRCAPLALFFYRTPEHLPILSPVLSQITHFHPDCQSACVILNVTIALLLQGQTKENALANAAITCPDASQNLLERIENAHNSRVETSPSGWVLDTLEVALWSLLHTASYEEAIVLGVNRGDDADTVGAVIGGLAGALYGFADIPERWLEPLQDRERLIECADRLFTIAI